MTSRLPQHRRDRIVIIGAGFGGFQAAQSLAGAAAEVLLIDRHNYHTFMPLLYQVATAQLEPSLVAYPVRTKLRGMKNVRFLQAEVKRVDFDNKLVDLGANLIPYDYLVMATGTESSYHGVPGAAQQSFTLHSLAEAIALRDHWLSCFEQAAFTADEVERRRLMTFTIVGGWRNRGRGGRGPRRMVTGGDPARLSRFDRLGSHRAGAVWDQSAAGVFSAPGQLCPPQVSQLRGRDSAEY